MVCQPDPTDALNTAKAISTYRATILCGTSTFLRLYNQNHKIHPLMLDSLRIVVAGAEKLNQDVKKDFELKFGKTVFEGYGATETTPVAAVNLPDALDTSYWHVQLGNEPGTVGMPLPGTSCKIVDPQTMKELPTGEAGMVLIGGAQVMQGYLNEPEKTAKVVVEDSGIRWYLTGDKGTLDKNGFLTIIDRYSRFAKVGGEMISLADIESRVKKAVDSTDTNLVAVAIPDNRKGEKIVVLSDTELEGEHIRQQLLADGAAAIMLPSAYLLVDELPVLGSGKMDLAAAKQIAIDMTHAGAIA